MKFIEKGKTYWLVLGVFIIVVSVVVYIAKTPKFSCDNWAKGFEKNFSCNIILTKKSNNHGIGVLTGINIRTRATDNCIDASTWIIDNLDKFKIGDTIIKNRGDYTIAIRRKNASLKIFLKCGDKIYKD